MKNIKLFRGTIGYQFCILLRIYYSNTNNLFAIQCNNGSFVIDKLTTGSFPLRFKVKESALYLTLGNLAVASVSAVYMSIGDISNYVIYMESDSTDLSDASDVTIH